MPSYVVIGASRGIGYAFLEHISKDTNNTVIGTARKPKDTIKEVKKDNLKNVHILQADLLDRQSLERAATETSKLVNGKVDYLILNGGYYHMPTSQLWFDEFSPDDLDKDLDLGWKTNVVGVIYALTAFLPLVQAGKTKKVLALSTGMADMELSREYDLWENPSYSVNKAALNMVIAKYAARYAKDGVLFLAISPGVVDVGHGSKFPRKCSSASSPC